MTVEPAEAEAGPQSRTASAIIRGLLATRKIKAQTLAEAIGVSNATISRRLNDRWGWSVDELSAVARFLDVPLSTLLPDPDPLED